MNPEALAFSCNIKLEPPSSADKTADTDRLKIALEDMGFSEVEIPLNIIRRLPEALRNNRFEMDLVLGVQKRGTRLLDIGNKDIYGLAVDIGSTNIACSLFDLQKKEKIDALDIENPQIKFGEDVLTRVQMAMTGEAGLLTQELISGINSLIKEICRRNYISPQSVYAVTVAGNTIMSHFFLGLDVRNISVSPYTPAVNRGLFVSAGEAGLTINSNAVVYVFPNAGSYVGGDIISGIIFSGIYKEKEPALFIDVGTNAEIVLGCKDWIMVGAGAAGPALEGGIARIGRKAESGTICGVKIGRTNNKIALDVIDNIEPGGICGSGMIDLIAELYSANIIDQAGKFTGPAKGIIEKNGSKAYLLYRSDKKELYLTENEIQNFLLSKAAMFSFLYVFTKSVGLTFKEIKKIYMAGALGCGINLENAIAIGLLPDMLRENFISLGNASIRGAEMILLNKNMIEEINHILQMITYREMNEDPDLMNILQGALFIPHTDPGLLKG